MWPDALTTLAGPCCSAWVGVMQGIYFEFRQQCVEPNPNCRNRTICVLASSWSMTGSDHSSGVHKRAGDKLAVIYMQLFQHHLDPGGSCGSGWSHHKHIKMSSLRWSVPPSGPEGFTLVGGCPSLIPHSRVLHCQPEPRPQGGKWELQMVFSAGLLMAG